MPAVVGLKSMEDHLKGFKQGSGQDDICIFKGSLAEMTHGLGNGKNKQNSPLAIAAVLVVDSGGLEKGISRGNGSWNHI